jgi:hypothetical protein
MVVKILATPLNPPDGGKLADEILAAVREDGRGADGDGTEADGNDHGPRRFS